MEATGWGVFQEQQKQKTQEATPSSPDLKDQIDIN